MDVSLIRTLARSCWFSLTLAAIAVTAVSPAVARKPGLDEKKTWQVEGRVVDSKGQPVPDVEVFPNELSYLPGETRATTRSDDQGRFVLTVAKSLNGRLLRASVDDGRQQGSKQLPYTVEQDAALPKVELVLQPAREITSSVTDSKGEPVANATVLVSSGYQQLAQAATDEEGHATLRVPAEAPLQYVVALKPSVGLDYWIFRGVNEPKSDPYKLAADHREPLKFVLNGVRQIAVRVVNDKDAPLADVKVYPWLIEKPNKGAEQEDLNLSGLSGFSKQTDKNGVATFDLVPSDNLRPVNFWAHAEGYFSPERHIYDPAKNNAEIVAKLVPLIRVGGRVNFADGKPAADIEVLADGAGYSFDRFGETGRTDKEGRFEFQVPPDHYYMFVAGNKEWASPAVNRVIRGGDEVADVELVVQPSTRVFGQATMGSSNSPVVNENISLYEHESRDYYKLPENEKLPNPKDSRSAIATLIVRSVETDAQGRFEFFVGPGKYYVISGDNFDRPEFEISDQKTLEVNLHAKRAENGPLAGRVVLSDDREHAIAGAKVDGFGTESFAGMLKAVTTADGAFQAKRPLTPMIMHGQSADGKLAGVVRIGAEDSEVVIPVAATTTAHGRLVDEETGQPATDHQIDYGIQVKFLDKTYSTFFGSSVTTDAQGEFTVERLVPGEEYTLSAVVEKDAEGHPRSWRAVQKVTAKDRAPIELGDVKLPKVYRPPTTQEKVAKAFADNRTAKQRVEARLRDTSHAYQRVLLVIGDPASPLIQRLYELEYAAELHGAAYNYQLVPVSTSDPDHAKDARDYLAEIGIPAPEKDGAVLAVLDEQGRVVESVPFLNLLTDRNLDAAKVAEFLDKHAPEMPDAEKLLADAQAQAKREGKRVFVQVSGPRCGWCFVLSRFLDDHRDVIDKEFAYVKLDDRLKNGPEVIKRVHPKMDGGIPWFVFLDDSGNPLMTSDGPEGNIGYPEEPEGRVQFEKMLRASPKHLTDDDIKSLIDALGKKKS